MKRIICGFLLLSAIAIGTTGCSQADRERAREKAAEARQKARAEGQQLRHDARVFDQTARAEAHKLGNDFDHAVNSPAPSANATGQSAEDKLRRGAADLKAAGSEAGAKLNHAAILAKVKTKLAADAGLSTVANVNVEVSGSVVTLNGTVASESERQAAAQSASQVSGVTRVINNIQIRP